MASKYSGSHERMRELCRRLKPIVGKSMDQVFTAYVLDDADGKKQLEAYVEALAAKHLTPTVDEPNRDLVPPRPGMTEGEYELGTVYYAGKPQGAFGLREDEWIQHVGIFGRSGAGKTNLGFVLFRELLKHKKPVLVFDWKRNYRDLLKLPDCKDVEVYTVGRDVAPFRFNPLIPPRGTDPKTWLKRMIEVVAHAYLLGNGVLYLLQETLDAIYEESGVYASKVEKWPTFRDVLDRAKERNSKGRESAWLASTLRALASLNFGEMSNLLNASDEQQASLEQLLTKPVILEMDALSQADKVFLISALLLWIHHYRLTEGQREVFKHAIMIEEAHHVLSNERHSLIGGQSVMEITFREVREYGESIVVLDQHPSKIAFSALGNSYCTIRLNLKHQKDVSAMGQTMLLQGEETDVLGRLEVGEAVVKLQGRVTTPFLVRIPESGVRKGLFTDDDLRKRMASRSSGLLIGHVTPEMFGLPPAKPSNSHGLSDIEVAFLQDVAENPDSGVAARYKRLALSVRRGQRIKSRLLDKGRLKEEEKRTNWGRVLKLFVAGQNAGLG